MGQENEAVSRVNAAIEDKQKFRDMTTEHGHWVHPLKWFEPAMLPNETTCQVPSPINRHLLLPITTIPPSSVSLLLTSECGFISLQEVIEAFYEAISAPMATDLTNATELLADDFVRAPFTLFVLSTSTRLFVNFHAAFCHLAAAPLPKRHHHQPSLPSPASTHNHTLPSNPNSPLRPFFSPFFPLPSFLSSFPPVLPSSRTARAGVFGVACGAGAGVRA